MYCFLKTSELKLNLPNFLNRIIYLLCLELSIFMMKTWSCSTNSIEPGQTADRSGSTLVAKANHFLLQRDMGIVCLGNSWNYKISGFEMYYNLYMIKSAEEISHTYLIRNVLIEQQWPNVALKLPQISYTNNVIFYAHFHKADNWFPNGILSLYNVSTR